MANFFLDNKDLQFHLQHPLMRKIVALKERNYTLKDHHELAPQNFEDAMDNYRRVLEIAGEVCGEVIAPNAEGVDHEGPRVENDHVVYAEGTARNIDAITKAGLSGMTLPYEYDGLNFPLVCFVGIDDSHKLTVRLFLLFQHHLVIVAVCHQHIHFVRIRQHLIECQVLYQFYRVYHLCNVADFQFCQSFVSFEFHSEISFNCYYYYAYI